MQNLRTVHADMEDRVCIYLFLQLYVGFSMKYVKPQEDSVSERCALGRILPVRWKPQGQGKHLCWSNSRAYSCDEVAKKTALQFIKTLDLRIFIDL